MLQAKMNNLNLGNVKIHKSISFVYELVNNSDSTVQINRLVLGCQSCTEASTNDTYLKPGDVAKINVVFTPNATGINMKRISVDYTVGGVHADPLILKFEAMVNQ